jgi:ABC-type multidrug transport system fused ATPase/permease subunit
LKKRLADIREILTVSERRRFVSLIFLNTLLSLADIVSIALVFVVLNIYSGEPSKFITPFLHQLKLQQQSLLPATFLIIIFVAKSIAGYFVTKWQLRYVCDTATRLTSKNLLLYLEGSYINHVSIDSAVWIRRICFQPIEFAQYILLGIQQIMNETILIIISIIALALYNIKLLIIVSLILLPAIFILSIISKRRLKDIRKNIKTANEKSIQYLSEAITGFVESNIYNKNDFFITRYSKSQFVQNRFIADMQVTQAIPGRFFETFAVLGLFVFIVIMKYSGNENSADILMLGAFVAAAYKIIPGISKIINFTGQAKTYLFTIDELSKEKTINRLHTQQANEEKINSIEMQHVKFSYADTKVFDDLNFSIHKNYFIGISGNSGQGKTTLIDILLGFLPPHSGKVLVNGKEKTPEDLKNLWPQIAYVKQNTFLLHDSMLNNIVLFENNFDKQKLEDILSVTGLKEWLDKLPIGINTVITENGKNISGGQKQRIAIARALYKDASIIILDEPFNELDENSEINLLKYFKSLSEKGKTVLLITHNTNSFSFCDNIFYLDEKK